MFNLRAQTGRTGYRLRVTEARTLRADTRHVLGVSRADTPSVRDLLSAARRLNSMLFDATEGEAVMFVHLRGDAAAEFGTDPVSPAVLLSTAGDRERAEQERLRRMEEATGWLS